MTPVRPTRTWRPNRQQVVLTLVNLLLCYSLYEAHHQVRIIRQRTKSFRVIHFKRPPQKPESPEVFDGVPLKRRILNIDDMYPVTMSTAPLPTTSPDPNRPVNCTKIAQKNTGEIAHAHMILDRETEASKMLQTSEIISRTKDCQGFVAGMGYRVKPSSEEEANFPLAFGIRMHWKVGMTERLLRSIYEPQHIYCIYIDKKSSKAVHLAMKGIAGCFSNVFIASRLEDYIYGSKSPVWADLQCMKDTIHTNVPWKYYMNLAGQEYPLKTNLELVRLLKLFNGTNDIESYPFPKHYLHRVESKHEVIAGKLTRVDTKKSPFTFRKLELRKGCSYNTFSRAFVEWILTAELPRRFINWANDTDSPDELVWATLNAVPEAPGGYPNLVTQNAKTFLSREVIWRWGPGYCYGKVIRGVCTFSVGDFSWLSRRWELFANKFDPVYDHIVLDCIDEQLLKRRQEANPDSFIDWRRMRNLPHILYGTNHTVITIT